MHLHLVTQVDDESIRDGLDRDPAFSLSHLKTRHVWVGEENGHGARVGMGREAESEVGLRALWVEVGPQACPKRLPSSKCSLQVVSFQSQASR